MIRTLIACLRIEAWISKFPPFFLACFLLMSVSDRVTFPQLFLISIFLFTHLISGYIANDVADWDKDMVAGDARAIHQLGKKLAWQIMAIAVLVHLIVIAIIAKSNFWILGILLGFTTLHLMYSFPPRFKNLGFASAVSSSFNQWLAAFYTFALIYPYTQPDPAILLGAWMFVMGLNGAIRHQINDYHHDRQLTNTAVQGLGVPRSLKILKVIQWLACGVLPLVSYLILPSIEEASVFALTLASFAIYHTMYYKRLQIHESLYPQQH